MKMLITLPKEIILEIASHIEREWVYQDYIEDMEDDGVDCIKIKELFNYYHCRDGEYYPLLCLYAACKSFQWLNKLEYICIESGDFHSNIVTRNINGVYHGMMYNKCRGIIGYGYYNNGKMVKENVFVTDTHYFYRIIDGVRIKVDECNLWDKCDCSYCINMGKIEDIVFSKDVYIKNIIGSRYDNGRVIIRKKNNILEQFDFLH